MTHMKTFLCGRTGQYTQRHLTQMTDAVSFTGCHDVSRQDQRYWMILHTKLKIKQGAVGTYG